MIFDYGTLLRNLLIQGESAALDPDTKPMVVGSGDKLDPTLLRWLGEAVSEGVAIHVREVGAAKGRRAPTSYDHLVASAGFDAEAGITTEDYDIS